MCLGSHMVDCIGLAYQCRESRYAIECSVWHIELQLNFTTKF